MRAYLKNILYKTIVLFVLIVFGSSIYAQYYNGSQLNFGKSRIQYKEKLWSFYRLEKFDVYFYLGGKEIALYAARYGDQFLKKLQEQFDYTLEDRIQIVVYNKHSDFKESNIGLGKGEDYNIGGKTQLVGSKIFIYYQGDHKKLDQQIRAGLTDLMINHIIYGGNVKDAVKNSTLLTLPDWYSKGLVSYVSRYWDSELDDQIRDGILSGKYKKFNRLRGDDAILAGHSIWQYIADMYGESVIPSILYMTEISRNVESGFLFILGVSLKSLSNDWLSYYTNRFESADSLRTLPEEKPFLKKTKKTRVYQQIKIDPKAKYIAYVTNESGQYKVWLFDREKGKAKRILKREQKLDRITDYSIPLIAWHPSGDFLTIFTERKGEIKKISYDVKNKKKEYDHLLHFEKILDFAYSDDNKKFVFSAVQNGQTDIFVYNILSNTFEQITKDVYDDLFPRFIMSGSQIVFSSNRINDTIKFEKDVFYRKMPSTYDLVMYDYAKKSNVLKRITNSPGVNEIKVGKYDKIDFSYIGDENGIYNRHIAHFDSTISFIDTIAHYRYITTTTPITNYPRNILSHDINLKSNLIAEILKVNGKYQLYVDGLKPRSEFNAIKLSNTSFMSERSSLEESLFNTMIKVDTLEERIIPVVSDSVKIKNQNNDQYMIDINNYIFESQKKSASGIDSFSVAAIDTNKSVASPVSTTDGRYKKTKSPKQRNYDRSYVIEYVISQLDNEYLRSSYQVFTGGPVTFNPGISGVFKIGATDILENYKIVGGVLLSSDLNNNGYFLCYENLEKRLDKQLVFYRQGETSIQEFSIIKNHTHELSYSLKWPFNEVLSLKTSAIATNTRQVYLSTDLQNLQEPTTYKTWGGVKAEWIYDNTISLGLNLYKGTRVKMWVEHYRQLDSKDKYTTVLGADYRRYIKIHRNLVWANRIATSTSFGTQKLVYYLGSVDNWINLGQHPTFDNTIEIDPSQPYAFQALASNLRGFSQNIRNGTSFALINSEIRWPIFKYFINRPLKSDFVSNFQIIGFFDIGTAWTGWTPYSEDNYLNNQVIVKPPFTITLITQKEPIVAGYGFGLRTKLLGYFVRTDWAWGYEDGVFLPSIFYLSLSLDF
jgi:hypothetical protein